MKPFSKRLILDTATKAIYIGLMLGDQVVDEVYQEGINDHSVTLIPWIEELLNRQHWQLQELDELVVGIGPGSYTGVRIGVTVAKMLLYAVPSIQGFYFSSLALLATRSDSPAVLALIDARRGNAFMAAFTNESGRLEVMLEDCLAPVEDTLASLPKDIEIVTQGKPQVQKLIQSMLVFPIDEVHHFIPNYLQITEAEKKQGETHGQSNS